MTLFSESTKSDRSMPNVNCTYSMLYKPDNYRGHSFTTEALHTFITSVVGLVYFPNWFNIIHVLDQYYACHKTISYI